MSKYIKAFEENSSYEEYIYKPTALFPNVSVVDDVTAPRWKKRIYYNKKRGNVPMDYQYLTLRIKSNGNIVWKCSGYTTTTGMFKTISYSKNNGKTWTEVTATNEGVEIPVIYGQTLRIKGENATYGTNGGNIYYNSFSGSTAQFDAEGNIMSLIYGDDFINKTTLESGFTFNQLFQNCTGLTSIENLVLPATTLKNACYYDMFNGCTSLTTVPTDLLPATALTAQCYSRMFAGCTSLTSTPALPATTTEYYCYTGMFNGCTSLITAPELPATTLGDVCYSNMFNGCTSLTTAPVLPATTLTTGCYSSMFSGCTSLTTAPSILPATTLTTGCYENMFGACSSLTTAPVISATTIGIGSCAHMFSGCTSLETAPVLPATTLSERSYMGMFFGCSSLTTAPELPATTLATLCYQTMFDGCTSLTTAPVLSATTLVQQCYQAMFYNCSSLNSITCLATNISATNCTGSWVDGVANLGTFIKDKDMTAWTTGINGIPTNWIVKNYGLDIELSQTAYTYNGSACEPSVTKVEVSGEILPSTSYTVSYSNNINAGTATVTITDNATLEVIGTTTFIINKVTPTVTAPVGKTLTYNATSQSLATAGSTNYGTLKYSTDNSNWYNSVPSRTNASSYTIYYKVVGDSNVNDVPAATISSVINKVTPTVTAPVGKTLTYNATSQSLATAGSTDYGTLKYSLNNSSWSTYIPSATNASSYTIYYKVEGNSNVNDVPAATISSVINKVTPTVTAPVGKTLTYNANAQSLATAGSTDYGTLKYSLNNSSWSTYIPSATNASSYTIYYKVEGDSNVNDVPAATISSVINKVSRTLNWTSNPSEVEIGETVTVTARPSSGSGDGTITYTSSNSSIAAINGDVVTGVATGSCTITATISEGINYFSATTAYTISCIPTDYARKYLTFKIEEDGNINWYISQNANKMSISYKLNGSSYWSTITASSSAKISVKAGDIIKFKGTNPTYTVTTSYVNQFRNSTAKFEIYGNIMSLIYGDNFSGQTTLESGFTFYRFFEGCTGITSAENLVLPATTLSDVCYSNMFSGCTSLTTAPAILPATTLKNGCYQYMFYGCTSLTIAPELPATILAQSCYYDMFNGCSSLTIAPELPATTLASSCYTDMFYNCTSLTTAPDLPAITLVNACYTRMFCGCSSINYIKCLACGLVNSSTTYYWVYNVASSGTFIQSLEAAEWETGVNGIPNGWTVQYNLEQDYSNEYFGFDIKRDGNVIWKTIDNGTPTTIYYSKDNGSTWVSITSSSDGAEIPVVYGDRVIFKGNNTSYANNTFGDTTACFNANGNIMSLLYGDNFVGQTTLPQQSTYTFYNLFNNTKTLYSFGNIVLPATTLTEGCYKNMFTNCTSSTIAPALPATALTSNCYYEMFKGCVGLEDSPVLLATTLASNCYQGMFSGCTNLNYIKCMATNISATNCVENWVAGVSGYGLFIKDETMTGWTINSISGIPNGWLLEDYNELNETPLTFKVQSDGDIKWYYSGYTSGHNATILYSKDNGATWERITATSANSGTSISVVSGDVVTFRGYRYERFGYYFQGWGTSSWMNNFRGSAKYIAYGNIMSISDYSKYYKLKKINESYYFYNMFANSSALTSAENLVLPATVLTSNCYTEMFKGCRDLITAPNSIGTSDTTIPNSACTDMFYGCTALTTAPELPAMTLGNICYYEMFYNCYSLTSTPELPATTLTSNCYEEMFYNCSGLTSAPELPATTLATYCYASMFFGCSSLTTAPELPATTLASYCYSHMFQGCKSLTTAPVLSAATALTSNCYYTMFYGCTNLTTLPTLTATTLADGCYSYMFGGCTGLISVPNNYLPATTLASSCYNGMFAACTGLTTLPTLTATTLASYCYANMFRGCTGLISVPNNYLPATTLASSCYNGMFAGCTGLTTAPTLAAESVPTSGYCGMFSGCTSLTTAPNLPATTLEPVCYASMFYGCTGLTTGPTSIGDSSTIMPASACSNMFFNCYSLTTAPELPATTISAACYYNMFYRCSGLTTAPSVLPATTAPDYCYCSMFYGCTSLTTAPDLPATTLGNTCYGSMFNGCTSLTTVPSILPATTLANDCYYYMFTDCSNLRTAPELPATTLASKCYYCMFYGCTRLNYIKCLATNISASNCTRYWVDSVASSGTFVKDASMTGWGRGVNGIPNSWTVQDAT